MSTRVLACTLWNNLTAPVRRVIPSRWTGGQTHLHISYAAASPAQWLDLYVPAAATPPPLLVLVHGGGFVMNDAESHEVQRFCRHFRDRGYACATINYRLAGEAHFPAALEDVKAALRFLGRHGGRYGYDTGRAAIWGESAGAYLAVMAAYTRASDYTGQPCLGEQGAFRFAPLPLSAVVDFYGPCDVSTLESQFQAQGIPYWVRRLANGWLTRHTGAFASAEECWMGRPFTAWTPDDFDAFSPSRQVLAKTCPYKDLRTLIVHGKADLTVAPAQSVQLHRALQATYGPTASQLVLVPHRKHADDRLYDPESLRIVEQFLQQYLQ